MKFKFKSKGETRTVNTPDRWLDVNVRQFLALRDRNDPIHIFAAFADVDPHLVFMAEDSNQMREAMTKAFEWVAREEPDWPKIRKGQIFRFQGNPYKIDIEKLPFGISILLEQRMQETEDLNVLTPYACAVYLQPLLDGEYKEDRVEEVEELVLKAPAIDMFPLASFFFSKLIGLRIYGPEDSMLFLNPLSNL